MRCYDTNPLARFRYDNKGDYGILKKYLRIAMPYLIYIFKKNKQQTLRHIPAHLGRIVTAYHTQEWRSHMEHASIEEQSRISKLKLAGIPPLYMDYTGIPSCSGDTMSLFDAMKCNPAKVAASGKLFYLNSLREEQALIAATQVCKSILQDGLPIRMLDFPSFMDKTRAFDGTQPPASLTKNMTLCLYLVGAEYLAESGFTQATLNSLLRTRQVSGKTTILCSHLDPAGFTSRYGINLNSLGAVELKFNDPSINNTLKVLTKELML